MSHVKTYEASGSPDLNSECYMPYGGRTYYGAAGGNYGSHAMAFTLGPLVLFFSYQTLVAVREYSSTPKMIISPNRWGPTTGKHIRELTRNHGRFTERVDAQTRGEFIAETYNLLVKYLSRDMAASMLGLDRSGPLPANLVAIETGEIVDAKHVENRGENFTTPQRARAREEEKSKKKKAAKRRSMAAKKAAVTRRLNREQAERAAAEAARREARVTVIQEGVFFGPGVYESLVGDML